MMVLVVAGGLGYVRCNLGHSPGLCLSNCVWDSSVTVKVLCTLGCMGASSRENGAAECCSEFGNVPADPLKQRPLLAGTLASEGVFGVPGVPFIEG